VEIGRKQKRARQAYACRRVPQQLAVSRGGGVGGCGGRKLVEGEGGTSKTSAGAQARQVLVAPRPKTPKQKWRDATTTSSAKASPCVGGMRQERRGAIHMAASLVLARWRSTHAGHRTGRQPRWPRNRAVESPTRPAAIRRGRPNQRATSSRPRPSRSSAPPRKPCSTRNQSPQRSSGPPA